MKGIVDCAIFLCKREHENKWKGYLMRQLLLGRTESWVNASHMIHLFCGQISPVLILEEECKLHILIDFLTLLMPLDMRLLMGKSISLRESAETACRNEMLSDCL